jgi:hypothetical protein
MPTRIIVIIFRVPYNNIIQNVCSIILELIPRQHMKV